MRLILSVILFLQVFVFVAFGEEGASGIEFSKEEVLKNQGEIEFKSYTGKVKERTPAEVMVELGRKITRELNETQSTGGKESRYFIKRIAPTAEKLGADIISLGKRAGINHIVTLTRVVQGYMEVNFDLSSDEANDVAYFILVYNALKRNDLVYVENTYAEGVANYLADKQVGLDTSYENWPGKTHILVPIRAIGGISASEVGDVATAKVAEEPGGNLDKRETLAGLRKDQVEEDFEKAKEEEQVLVKKEEALKKEAEALEKEIEKKQEEIEKKEAVGEEVTQLKEEKAALELKKEAVVQKLAKVEGGKERLEDKQIALADEEAKVAEERAKINEEKAQQKILAIHSEETAIKENAAQKSLSGGKIFFLKTLGLNGLHFDQRLYIIDPQDDSYVISPVEKISGRKLNFVDGDPLLIVYDDPGLSKLFLARFERDGMKIKAKGKEGVYSASPIWLQSGAIYVIGLDKDAFLLKYDHDLNLLAKSDVPIYPDTEITFANGKLYCTTKQGSKNHSVLVLNDMDLKKIKTIK